MPAPSTMTSALEDALKLRSRRFVVDGTDGAAGVRSFAHYMRELARLLRADAPLLGSLLRREATREEAAMIPRYTRPEMAQIWAPETRFRIWFEIEAHAASAMAELGLIPKSAAKAIWDKGSKAKFDVARIDEIEREVKHDVIAFLTHLAEHVGPEARFVHPGLTSSDVLDTCFNVQLVRAADLLLADLDAPARRARRSARFEHKLTPTIGRSHGIHAEPTTFGLKLAQAYAEFARARERLVRARAEVATCAISGAVGTFANVDPRVEAYVAEQDGPDARADLDPGDPARPARHVLRHARRHRLLAGAAGDRGPPPAAHRGAGGGGILLGRARRAPPPCRTSATRC